MPSSEACYPLGGLLDLDFVEGYGAVPAEPASGIPLPALVALLLDGAIALAAGASQEAQITTKKGGKKSKRDRSLPSLTLISPAGFNQAQKAVLLKATEQSGRAVKNIFNRGVAVVAGSLYTASRAAAAASAGRNKGRVAVAGDLCDALGIQGEGCGCEEPLVMYLRVYALEGSAGKLYYDAALVRCEGSKGARQVGAPLGFERLCTAAALGGALQTSAPDGKGIVAAMTAVVAKLLLQAKATDLVRVYSAAAFYFFTSNLQYGFPIRRVRSGRWCWKALSPTRRPAVRAQSTARACGAMRTRWPCWGPPGRARSRRWCARSLWTR
jgi:hypothetical protein